MKKNKAFLCAALVTACLSTPAQAAEQAKPLHIKIHNGVSASSSQYGINIRHGKVLEPVKETKKTKNLSEKEIKIQVKTEAPTPPDLKEKPSAPKVIQTSACHEVIAQDPNHNDDLAKALKAYITEEKRDPAMIDDIYYASTTAEVDFELLIIKAMIESDLGRLTASPSSSARGVFQYIEPTWLTLMKRYGGRIGYGDLADAITIDAKTQKPKIKEDSVFTREEILDLRHDTNIASLIKANQVKDEAKILTKYRKGIRSNATDYYIVHMLGLSLAREFYKLLDIESAITLADSENSPFKNAAKLNPYFFYDGNKNALTATEAYTQFHSKISRHYMALRSISAKYGNGEMASGRCQMPQIKSAALKETPAQKPKVSASKGSTRVIESRLDLSSIRAASKTIKVKMTRD